MAMFTYWFENWIGDSYYDYWYAMFIEPRNKGDAIKAWQEYIDGL